MKLCSYLKVVWFSMNRMDWHEVFDEQVIVGAT